MPYQQQTEDKSLTAIAKRMKAINDEFHQLQEQMEDVARVRVTPMKDGIYAESNRTDDVHYKIGDWPEFWNSFFGGYEQEALETMVELRDKLNENIEAFKINKYTPITTGGVWRE